MKKTRKIFIPVILFLIVILAFTACSSDMGARADEKDGYDSVTNESYGNVGGDVGSTSEDKLISDNRKIIKTVRESIQTDKYDDFMTALNTAIADAGGYITSATHSGNSYYDNESLRYSSITVRIPAESLDSFTSEVEGLAVVKSYNEYIEDVTASYVDVESRIAVLAAEETALLEMLEQAATVTTALEIRTRLNSVQSDLASLRAQKATYDTLIAYSTVHMSINEVRRAESTNPGFFEEVGGNFNDSLYNIGQGFRSFGVWLLGDVLYILLFLAAAAGVLILLILVRRRVIPFIKSKKYPHDTDENTATPTVPTQDNENE